MGAPNEILAKTTKDYLTRFPNSSKASLAQKMAKEHPLIYKDQDAARSSIRYYTGSAGAGNLKSLKDKTFIVYLLGKNLDIFLLFWVLFQQQ